MCAINRTLIDGLPLFAYDTYSPLSDSDFSIYNPDGKIAFVLLYTPNIVDYACIAEHNFKRYCDQHNYALYVYRDLPDEFKGKNTAGSWLKPWVLKKNISQHEWVFWIDADVLVLNPNKKIEELLEGRELLFSRDIAAWAINSGIMGFKHTESNIALLQEMCDRIDALEDKSGVYSNQGDQFHIIECLKNNNCLNERSVVDCLTINTPPAFKQKDTFMVHYAGEPSPLREIHMLNDDQSTLQKKRLSYNQVGSAFSVVRQTLIDSKEIKYSVQK